MKTHGVIIIEDGHGETLAAEIYGSEQERTSLWEGWIDSCGEHYRRSGKDLTVRDCPMDRTEIFQGRTDKQIGMMMSSIRAVRQTDSRMAEYARRNGMNPYEPGRTRAEIDENPQRYRRFLLHTDSMERLLNAHTERVEEEGEYCHVQSVFDLKGHYSFFGGESIRSTEDVAWIFRQLSNASVENTFFLLQKGDRNIIVHAGIGTMSCSLVDTRGAILAARRMEAEKVWLVHNHPSGSVRASRADMQLLTNLKKIFGDTLQEGIIINTTSGKFGVFDTSGYPQSEEYGNKYVPEIAIPVYAFDKQVFKERNPDDGRIIRCSQDVAMEVSALRFGDRAKKGFLCMDLRNGVRGNFYLKQCGITPGTVKEVAKEMMEASMCCGGPSVILYGSHQIPVKTLEKLQEEIDVQSCGTVMLTDYVCTEMGMVKYSACDNGDIVPGSLAQNRAGERTAPDVEVVETCEGNFLTVNDGGTRLPSRKLRRTDYEHLRHGTVSKEELAGMYYRNGETGRRPKLIR